MDKLKRLFFISLNHRTTQHSWCIYFALLLCSYFHCIEGVLRKWIRCVILLFSMLHILNTCTTYCFCYLIKRIFFLIILHVFNVISFVSVFTSICTSLHLECNFVSFRETLLSIAIGIWIWKHFLFCTVAFVKYIRHISLNFLIYAIPRVPLLSHLFLLFSGFCLNHLQYAVIP